MEGQGIELCGSLHKAISGTQTRLSEQNASLPQIVRNVNIASNINKDVTTRKFASSVRRCTVPDW